MIVIVSVMIIDAIMVIPLLRVTVIALVTMCIWVDLGSGLVVCAGY
jgi:hypothetical protein